MEKEDIAFLNGQKQGVQFSELKILLSTKSIGSNEDVLKAIKDFQPSDGWISLQSSPAKRIQGADFDINGEHILAGDFCNASGVSLSVRFDDECWKFSTCMEANEGELVLKRNVRQLSKISNHTYLNYDVYYKYEPEYGYRPYFSAFTGFTEEEK